MLILQEPNSLKVHTLAFSPDGQTLAAVSGRNRHVTLWDLQTRQVSANLGGHGHRVVAVAFAPLGGALASACSGNEVRLWGTSPDASGRPRWETKLRVQLTAKEGAHAPGQLAFSPGGGLLATNIQAHQAQVVPARLRDRITLGMNLPWFAHQPRHIHPLQMLQLPGGAIQAFFPVRFCETACLGFSPDGRWLATGSFDRTVHLQQAHGDEVWVLNQGKKVHYLAFSPDGRTLAAGSPGGLVKVWDATTGAKRSTLKGQLSPLHALCYSPDGRVIATAGAGTVCFWDVASARSRTAFDWGVGEVHAVAFAPDGMRAAAGGAGRIVVWDIDDWDL